VDEGQVTQTLSRELVAVMKKYFGKGALKAKTYFADDLCFVVMRDALTTAELTMLENDGQDAVRQFRMAYQETMKEEIVSVVERVTRRRVLTYYSQLLFDPHVIVEVFVFEDSQPGRMVSGSG
jgi:uncharacterized protein YbcI